MMSRQARTVATLAGVMLAEKITERPLCLRKSMTSSRPGQEAAQAGEGLRERADDEVDLVLDAEVLGRAAAVRAQHADRVRVVDHQAGAEPLA